MILRYSIQLLSLRRWEPQGNDVKAITILALDELLCSIAVEIVAQHSKNMWGSDASIPGYE